MHDPIGCKILTLRVTPTPRAVRFRARPLCGLPRRGNPGPQIDVVVRATLPQCLRDAAGSNGGSGAGRRALLITSTARHVHTGIRGCRHVRVYLQLAGAKPGLWPGQGAPGLRLARQSRGANDSAGRCWPDGAGGSVAQRRQIAVAWASAPGRRLETSVYFRI